MDIQKFIEHCGVWKSPGRVHKCQAATADEFLAVLDQRGVPAHVIGRSSCTTEHLLAENCWVMGDNLDDVLREVLRWDELGCEVVCCPPAEDDLPGFGDHVDGTWQVRHLPSWLNEAVDWHPGDEGAGMSQEELRAEFFSALMTSPDLYGLNYLEPSEFVDYLADWAIADEMRSNPAKFRAQKTFGVIEHVGGVSVSCKPMRYSILGPASGSICATVLTRAGISTRGLVGKTCTWNGLGEIEAIGGVSLTAFLPARGRG